MSHEAEHDWDLSAVTSMNCARGRLIFSAIGFYG
jgi:hypothetical protein